MCHIRNYQQPGFRLEYIDIHTYLSECMVVLVDINDNLHAGDILSTAGGLSVIVTTVTVEPAICPG